MIGRLSVAAAAVAPVVASATGLVRDAPAGPTVWHALGYPFEAGSMIAALCACIAVRFYSVQHDAGGLNRWILDAPVSALALMFTAGAVIAMRPQPLTALLLGTGLGAVGAGIIMYAKKYVDRWLGDQTGG